MDPQRPEDRRKHQRIRVDFTMVFHVDQPPVVRMQVGWDREVEAIMLDISEGGIALLTEYDIPFATLLDLRFVLINVLKDGGERARKITAAGLVRYNMQFRGDEHRIGICYTKIADADRKAIKEFIDMAIRSGNGGR